MSALETITYRDHKISIYQDEDPSDPRNDDQHCKMVCYHPRYKLGDEQQEFESKEELDRFLKENDVLYRQPLYLYDHSGITIKTTTFAQDSAGRDTSNVGIIYINLEERKKMRGDAPFNLELAKTIMAAEVTEYADYLEGNTYGFITEG